MTFYAKVHLALRLGGRTICPGNQCRMHAANYPICALYSYTTDRSHRITFARYRSSISSNNLRSSSSSMSSLPATATGEKATPSSPAPPPSGEPGVLVGVPPLLLVVGASAATSASMSYLLPYWSRGRGGLSQKEPGVVRSSSANSSPPTPKNTASARPSRSASDVYSLATATHRMPAQRAAMTPSRQCSTTTHLAGSTPSRSAARAKHSGWGRSWATSS
mmetsp:Transcript_1337/g.2678  ORF Transcript_1337/g.2678 Transcript_1337/m.2678 type:complete len:220 (+) Transcript_1337:151-810(+)